MSKLQTPTPAGKISVALASVKNGLTLPELINKTGVNQNTARRIVAKYPTIQRKCRITGKTRTAYKRFSLSLNHALAA